MEYIDLSKLPISDAKQVINIFGLNTQGELIRSENDAYTKSEIDEKLNNVKVDLTDYYTKVEVDEIIKDIDVNVDADLTDYYTKVEVDEIIKDIETDVDLTGYATEQWVKQQGYVTDFDVNDYVGNEIGQVEERFNDYYTKVEVDEKVANVTVDLTGYATEQWVKNQDYATNSDVDEKVANVTVDLTGYATEEYVNDAIANIDIPEGGDSYTKEEIDSMIGDINNILTSI